MRALFTQRSEVHARRDECGTRDQGPNVPMEDAETSPAHAPSSGVITIELPRAQRSALEAIHRLSRERRRPPTMRDLAEALRVTSLGYVGRTIARLELRELISRRPGEHRSIELTAAGLAELGVDRAPASERELRLERLLSRAVTLLPLAPTAPLLVAIRKELGS